MKTERLLNVIECRGSEYDIGRQYGEGASENLRRSVAFLEAGMRYMPYRADKAALVAAAQAYRANVHAFDRGAEERFRGMADGAGVAFEEIFALQCYSELFVNFPGLAGMCTSFAATGPATRGGMTIIGQNVDWHPDATLDLVRITREDGRRMLGLYLCGYGCCYLTSDGLGNCANLTLSPLGPVRGHVPLAVYLHAAMRAGTVEGAMTVLARCARGVGYFHVAGGNGTVRGVESVYDGARIIEPSAGLLVHGNHYETEEYKRSDGAVTHIRDSFGRTERLRRLMRDAHGDITVEGAMSMLRDHAYRPGSVCRHRDPGASGFPSVTRASFVMIPAERRLYIASGAPCENKYVEHCV